MPEKMMSIAEVAQEVGAKPATIRARILRAELWSRGQDEVRQFSKTKMQVRVWPRGILVQGKILAA
jgi:hypothetical protein